MQRRGRDNELISFLEFCNIASNLQVDLNFPDDVLAVAQGDPLQIDVGLERRDNELRSFLEFCDLPSNSEFDLNFPDDVLLIAQSDPLQNDTSLGNRNLIQNPNPNQNQEQGLFSPFDGMHLNPNFNDLMEPRYQPYHQLNPELYMPGNQNYMARPPCPYTNVTNVASISRGETDISHSSRKRRDGITMNRSTYNGIGNSASELMQQNAEGFVRNTRMRVGPGQGRTSMVAVSPNTAQYNMYFPGPNPNPSQLMTNPALASNTLSIPLARTNTTRRQPMSNRALASNALSIPLVRSNINPGQLTTLAFNPLSIPLAGGNSIHRVGTDVSPMQTIPAPAPATAVRVTSHSWTVALPSSDHELARFRATIVEVVGLANQRMTSHQQPIRAIASSDASQIRSQGVSLHQAVLVPTIPSVPASSALSVSVPDHTASTSQTGNSGVWVVFLPSEERPSSLPPIRIPSSDHELSQFRATLAGLANQRTTSHHELARFMAMLEEVAGLANQRMTSYQQPIWAISSSDASQIRSQGVSLHQAVPVPTIPSVPALSALSVPVPDHTASTSQTGNSGGRVVFLPSEERPSSAPPIRTRLPRGTSSIVPLQARNLVRDLHPDADERQLVTLLSGTREMLDEWREIDRHIDMRLDTDHMSHEELVALTERIGSVSTGVSEEIVNERMIQRPFSALLENETDPCCICQEEYVEDDQVGTLECGHNFHRECIKKWLGQKNICPICKKPGIRT